MIFTGVALFWLIALGVFWIIWAIVCTACIIGNHHNKFSSREWDENVFPALVIVPILFTFAIGGATLYLAAQKDHAHQYEVKVRQNPQVSVITDSNFTDHKVSYMNRDGEICHAKTSSVARFEVILKKSEKCNPLPKFAQDDLRKNG